MYSLLMGPSRLVRFARHVTDEELTYTKILGLSQVTDRKQASAIYLLENKPTRSIQQLFSVESLYSRAKRSESNPKQPNQCAHIQHNTCSVHYGTIE